jgi:hypothetical protein
MPNWPVSEDPGLPEAARPPRRTAAGAAAEALPAELDHARASGLFAGRG